MNMIPRRKECKIRGRATIAIGRLAAVLAAGLALGALQASAALKYEPTSYAARDALLLQLDGIRNAGLLKAHDGDASQWIDLAAGNSVSFGNKTGSGVVSEWADDGYVFGGGEIGRLADAITLGNAFTIQLVFDADKSAQTANYPFFFDCGGDNCGFYTYKKADNNQLIFRVKAVSGVSDVSIKPWTGRHYYATALYDKGKSSVFETATGTVTAGTTTTSVGARAFTVGGRWLGTASDTERYLTGTIKAVRIYNKVLSTAELSQNRALDDARFFNGIPVTNVVVATSVAGLDGNEETGVYAYDEDGYTFTAPKKATKDGANYACTGYTLETWNGSSWSAPVRNDGALAAAFNDTSAKVRLTWQWQYAGSSASTDLDPLFEEYVTDGLVLHLDGIRNAGADKPHDYSAKQWIDLVNGNIASVQHDYADTSTWVDDGYYFGGRSYAQFVNAISGLTNMVTVQIVCDTTTNALHTLKTSSNPYILWPSLIGADGDQLNIYYDMNAATRGRLTFKNADGGNADLANGAAKDAWEGRYVTAIRDNTTKKNYILQTTAIADAVSVNAASGNIAANTLRVGSSGGLIYTRRQRWFIGTIKAVRIYDRVLSDEELAQNRAIDEVRFFGAAMPVTNVVVASSVRGVSGDAPEGAYALSAGGHTFTAPASVTVGEDSYSCTGYTLETWDGSAWGAPVAHSGVLSVALTDTTEKVRLTWQWTHTAGPGYDAAFNDYATDGLVVHLDGIRNTGVEAVHDRTAVTWADLANHGDYASFIIGGDKCGWMTDGYRFDSWKSPSYAVMNSTRTLGNTFTVQAVVDFDTDESCRIDVLWPSVMGSTASSGDPFVMYYNLNNVTTPGVNFKVGNTQVKNGGVTSWDGKYMTGWSDGVDGALFQTATRDTTAAFNKTVGTQTFTFGSSNGSSNGSSSGYDVRRFNGFFKSARIYNRALTDAELAKNRATDEVRFFGSPAVAGDLIVASTVEGLGGNLPCGAYRPAAGYAFTAPAAVVVDGIPYELKGYTLETWDGSAWTAPVRNDGAFAVVPDVSTASKRLTWNWAVKSRLVKIPDYDVDDYVQDGLYLHFDGIRNAGANAEHSDDAATWANLGTGGASFDAVFDYASNASAGDGWAEDGYDFVYGGKFAVLGSNPTFASSLTIQIVTKARETDNPDGNEYPTYFGSTNDYLNIYGFKAVAQAFFKVSNGNRFELQPSKGWQGEYLTAFWHYGANKLFQETLPSGTAWQMNNNKWHGNGTTFSGQPFYIGGVYNGNAAYANERRLNGKIQAIRVYNRSLSDEELEHNRMVDEARFKGNLPGCNVTIATRYGDGTGVDLAEGVGNYKVEGSYTFSATQVKDSAGALEPVAGYILETWTGSGWGARAWHDGQAFSYAEKMGKVRIKWSPRPNGMMVILR